MNSQIFKSCPVENVVIETKCSQYTDGSEWVFANDYYAIDVKACVPSLIAEKEDDEILDWVEFLQYK